MAYKNGKDILPDRLLNELQKYIQGEIIYIPKKETIRVGWGEMSGSRLFIDKRNQDIYEKYKNGATMDMLVELYHLSEESIRKIIYKKNQSRKTMEVQNINI